MTSHIRSALSSLEVSASKSPYADFFSPEMSALPSHVQDALARGAQPPTCLPGIDAAPELLQPGYWPVETGYSIGEEGSARVFVFTQMPEVSPEMWTWWFGWHGCDARRYQLWHPHAHVNVAWADNSADETRYIGRTSNVTEYVGNSLHRFSIQFIHPSEFGLNEAVLAARGEVAICARATLTGLPFQGGCVIHHIRPVQGGSEMRSRFWLMGENLRIKGLPAQTGKWLGRALGLMGRPSKQESAELLVHCAEEMNHLAARLPALYACFGPIKNCHFNRS